jgi:hypothetical protein
MKKTINTDGYDWLFSVIEREHYYDIFSLCNLLKSDFFKAHRNTIKGWITMGVRKKPFGKIYLKADGHGTHKYIVKGIDLIEFLIASKRTHLLKWRVKNE